MLTGRRLRDKMPCVPDKESDIICEARKCSDQAKRKAKEVYDAKGNVKRRNFEVGEYVLVKAQKKGKYTAKFETTPTKIIKIKGSAITVMRNGREITRNKCDIKKIGTSTNNQSDQDSLSTDSEEEYEYVDGKAEQQESEQEESDADEPVAGKDCIIIRRSSRTRKPPEKLKLYIRD